MKVNIFNKIKEKMAAPKELLPHRPHSSKITIFENSSKKKI